MPKKAPTLQAKKHLKEILLLFSVPIGIILIIVAFLYVPRLFANPTHDFIYCEGYSCDSRFVVDTNGKLTLSTESARNSYRDYRLYYYDAKRDATRPIQLADAESYLLDASSKSPEGYTLEQNTNGGGFLFWSDYSRNWSLKKGFATKPVALSGSDITFIGWVFQASWTAN